MNVKKIYVKSGQLEVVFMANGPIDAIDKALNEFGKDKQLDPNFIYLDERGFRETDAEYKVPVEQALVEAGFSFDDSDDDNSGTTVGFDCPPELSPSTAV